METVGLQIMHIVKICFDKLIVEEVILRFYGNRASECTNNFL